MSINLDLGQPSDPGKNGHDRVTPVLSALLLILVIVAAVMIVLISRQRSQEAAALPPAKTTVPAVAQSPAATQAAATGTAARPMITAAIAAGSPTMTAAVAAASPTTPAGATPVRTASAAALTPTVQPAIVSPVVTSTAAGLAPTATRPPAGATTTPPTRVVAPSPVAPTAAPTQAPAAGPATSWYFAGGSSVSPYRTLFSIFNPGSVPASVMLTLYAGPSKTVQQPVTVPPLAAAQVSANALLPAATFGAGLTSDQPVYAERFTVGARDGVSGTGLRPARTFYFPEAQTGDDFTTYLQVFNPGTTPATVSVTYLPVGADSVQRSYLVPALTPVTISVQKDVPMGIMGIIVDSNQAVVVDHAIYFDNQETAYGGPGLPAAGKTWYVPAGNTQPGFTARVTILNPNSGPATVKATLLGSKQAPVSDLYGIEARSKDDIVLNDRADEQIVAAILESDVPIVAESVTYYLSGGENGPVAAYSAPAIPALAKQWYLSDLPSSSVYDSYVSLLNAGNAAASVSVTYIVFGEPPVTKTYQLAASSMSTVRVRDEVGGKTVASASVSSTQPIAVARVTMFSTTVGASASAGTPGQ